MTTQGVRDMYHDFERCDRGSFGKSACLGGSNTLSVLDLSCSLSQICGFRLVPATELVWAFVQDAYLLLKHLRIDSLTFRSHCKTHSRASSMELSGFSRRQRGHHEPAKVAILMPVMK